MKPENLAEWSYREVETLLHSIARYTKFVRSTKVTLGLLALLLTGAVLFYPLFKKDEGGIRIAFSSIQKGEASPTRMIKPQFHGSDKSGQPFMVTADTATQNKDDTVLLDKVTADIKLKSGHWLSMSANNGLLNTKSHELDLKGAIAMHSDDGYEMSTESMHVDMARKTAITNENIQGQGPLGTLKASGAQFDNKTAVIHFNGPVFVTIYSGQGKS